MPLPLTVVLVVFAVLIVIGGAGYLIDRSAERHERSNSDIVSRDVSSRRH
jgi:hypothetical protein